MTKKPFKKIILLIDDDEDIVHTIKSNLLIDGYDVVVAYSGLEGMAIAKNTPPHLVLLDLNLPDLDGIGVCENLRKEYDFPIIMLTARDTVFDKVLGLKSGADDYIVKPFDYLELSARITAIFNRVDRISVQYKQQLNDLEINFRTRQVTLKNNSIKLTKTEFELLALFASNNDKALPREFIEKQIWKDSELYSNSRALDVHIQRLRKKIEQAPNSPEYIVTIPGVGYKFNVTK